MALPIRRLATRRNSAEHTRRQSCSSLGTLRHYCSLALLCLLLLLRGGALARAEKPSVPWKQRGIALGLFAEEPEFDYGPLLQEIAATGASHVSVVVPYYQHDVRSVRIAPDPRLTPHLDNVARTIRQARKLGLSVLLFPILRLRYQLSVSEWRGTLRPKDPRRWWRSYGDWMVAMARLASRTDATLLCVGSELESMDGDPAPWKDLTARIRRVFEGKLVYSANWFNLERTAIWNLVDIAGISAYFWLVGRDELEPSPRRLVQGWREYRARIGRWWSRVGKPLLFTELGYRSAQGTAADPWEESTRKPVSLRAQADAYRAFELVWRDAPFLRGIYLWNWFGWGGPNSREFTPRGKPAVDLICRWYGAQQARCPSAYGDPTSRRRP
jgi:hypothetical protein